VGEKSIRIEIPGLAWFARRHAEGESLEDLAAEAGVSQSTLYKRLTEAGLFEAAPVKKVTDQVPRDEIVQRYEAGESVSGIVAYLRKLGFSANWYWVDSILNEHQVIRHPKPGEAPKGAAQGFSVDSAAELRAKMPLHYLPRRRRPASKETQRTFGDPSAPPEEPVLSELRLKRLAERHAEGKGRSIESLAASVGVNAVTLSRALRKAGYVVSNRSLWVKRELDKLTDEIVRMYRDEGASVDEIAGHLGQRHEVSVSADRVRALLKNEGVTLRPSLPPGRRFPGKERESKPVGRQEGQTAPSQPRPRLHGIPPSEPRWRAIYGREEELANRILNGGEAIKGIAEELGVDHGWLAAALKKTGHLPNTNLTRLRKRLRPSQ